ncbi:glycosyltransferase [Murimonas intestini]|uniref:Glycosyltransferase involved in cell wall biosynthesis n=1 Tax=Murimonas intestini TaxID=1337051 RepID=A0AB73T6L3_9FIRM|nr:glycosyltransferase [Murimonas intestini]MCR1839593.1 glycosyltransferase [Murimonas intestini]MCR1866436.1 glycosyltransferase [Murimonas intestini]MCR1882446.1 glycosyltransferase [Murimonas intestini]
MLKKRVAIFSRALWKNGATKSLVELLRRIDLNKCNIDLYVLDFSNKAEWVKKIPKEINIEKVPKYGWNKETLYTIFFHPIHFIKSLYAGGKLKSNLSEIEYMKYNAARMPINRKKYDIAISYRHFDVDIFYVKNNMNASKKFFWIHGIQNLHQAEVSELKSVYKSYDQIFPVSIAAQNNIITFFPELLNKCKVAYCIVDSDEIIENSKHGRKLEKMQNQLMWNILTIGRLSAEKGIDLALRTCKELKKSGYSFRWFVLGEGKEREKLEYMIKQENLEEFILLGYDENPYGYLASCDIYVQTSVLESYGLTINEAKIFHKPIVCTNIPAAREQIIHKKTGLLVRAAETDVAAAISTYIDDKLFRESVIFNLQNEDNSHFESVEIFNEIIANE